MATRWHINPYTDFVGKCSTDDCPFKNQTEHFSSEQEAYKAYETRKPKFTAEPRADNSMKGMDANDLAHEIFVRVDQLGFDRKEFGEILELASVLHAKQFRRNRGPHAKTPYIEHPMRACLRIMRDGVKNPDIARAALLHDTVEDGSIEFVRLFSDKNTQSEHEAREILSAYIAKRHGEATRDLVLAVTNDLKSSQEKKDETLREKTAGYVEHLKAEVADNPAALIVKLVGDYFDNAGSLQHTDLPGKEATTFKQAYKYLPCIDIFREELKKDNPYATEEQRRGWARKLDRVEHTLNGLLTKYDGVVNPG